MLHAVNSILHKIVFRPNHIENLVLQEKETFNIQF